MGDFNSRKGQLSESIDENDMSASQFIDGSDTFELRTGYHIPHSHSLDKTVKNMGDLSLIYVHQITYASFMVGLRVIDLVNLLALNQMEPV